jgi:hypothetical protein
MYLSLYQTEEVNAMRTLRYVLGTVGLTFSILAVVQRRIESHRLHSFERKRYPEQSFYPYV